MIIRHNVIVRSIRYGMIRRKRVLFYLVRTKIRDIRRNIPVMRLVKHRMTVLYVGAVKAVSGTVVIVPAVWGVPVRPGKQMSAVKGIIVNLHHMKVTSVSVSRM